MPDEKDKVIKVDKNGSTSVYRESSVKMTEHGSTHVMTNDDEDLKLKAKRAEYAVTDLVDTALDRAVNALKTRTEELLKSDKLDPEYVVAKKDSKDISRLGPLVTELATTFEDTITMIRNHPYDEQVELLTGYWKLLEEQINVIDSRIQFVKRVK